MATPAREHLSRAALDVILRASALVVCLLVALAISSPARSGLALALLAAVAVLASVIRGPVWLGYLVVVAETVAAAVIAVIAPGEPVAILPYLAAPLVIAALRARYLGALVVVAAGSLTIVIAEAIRPDSPIPDGAVDVVLWLAVTCAVALAAWAVVYVRSRIAPPATDYATANRLLTALREVARGLPEGLDAVSQAESALESLHRAFPEVLAACAYVRVDGDALIDVAALPAGGAPVAWDPATDRGLWGQVWDTGLAAQRSGSFSDPTVGHAAVIPLTVGARRVGLVGLEWNGPAWPPQDLRDAQRLVDDAALRIDTAYLFSEVRALATAEERRRLSREIHDGVAQEVAALGFLVDAARSTTSDERTRADLDRLREELTRLVTELRLSIFDLRSNAGGGMRLGEALADYARSIGSQSGWTVHLVLEEGPNRLPRGTEAELLRIAQEALTNVRKHARARTVWVSLRVLAPSAFLRVADDGTGVPDDVGGHFGLAVMRERAARIAAALSIRPRPGGGTVVECVLGQADAPDPSAPDALAGLG